MRVTSFTSIIFLLTLSLVSFQNCSHLPQHQKQNQTDLSSLNSKNQNIFKTNSQTKCAENSPKKIYYEAFWLSRSESNLVLTKIPSMDEQLEHSKVQSYSTLLMNPTVDETEFSIEIPLSKPYCEVTGHIGSLSLEGSSFPFAIEKNQLTMLQKFSLNSPEFTEAWGEGVYIVISYYTPTYEGSDNSAFLNNPWFQNNKNVKKLLFKNQPVALSK